MPPQGFIGKDGYYESDGDFGDTRVPKRPSPDHAWNGSAWQFSQPLKDARIADAKAVEAAELDRPAFRRIIAVMAKHFGVPPLDLAREVRDEP